MYGIIGWPLGHSFSPTYFNTRFKEEGLRARYDLFPLAAIDEFPDLLRRYPNLCGLNVTIPYKQAILPYLDQLDPTASAVGAVNCIRIECGSTTGFNTDVIGFEQTLVPLLQEYHRSALILGTGGAAQAVAFVCRSLGITVTFASRNPSGADTISYSDIDRKRIDSFRLIINATPLGMLPHIARAPLIPYQYLNREYLLYDLVYNPAKTLFLKRGEEQGAVICNGYGMLLGQAEASWNIWQPS